MAKILVVDDDAGLRGLYQTILADAGYEVVIAESGHEGLSKLAEGGFDLVLLDMMMPVMSGIDFLAQRTDKQTPVVVMTNLDKAAVVDQITAAGAKGFLSKVDVNPDQFVQEVQKYLPKAE